MFDVGFWEVALIFIMGLLFLGPEKMPKIASQLGRWVGKARRTATQLKYQLEREVGSENDHPAIYTPPPKTATYIPPAGVQKGESSQGVSTKSDQEEPKLNDGPSSK
jgi:Tat protein translocase TatB subunit